MSKGLASKLVRLASAALIVAAVVAVTAGLHAGIHGVAAKTELAGGSRYAVRS